MIDPVSEKEFEKKEFQAEVKRLLDIVVNSLYTEKEIFARELISNASDALEKFRLLSLMEENFREKDVPLEITIEADEKERQLVISDTGVGMNREELVENLGTIAHSGSRDFLKHNTVGESNDAQLIGQFGVGFYSVFMVASSVRVLTLSYRPDASGWEWNSEGAGSYNVAPVEGLNRGTKIIISLKEDAAEFAQADRIKNIIKQYSSFVPFDIKVNGEKINTVRAIWTRNKNEVKDEEYEDFYKFLTNSFTGPIYRLHLSSDAPIQLNALFYIPSDNLERFGFGRLDPGVNLYSRKVLIQQGARDILPEYLRFVKGVVDSEDLPLNISRETAQNSRLISKMCRFLTKRLISYLDEESSRDKEKYNLFWENFSAFIKEGCVSDADNREQLAKLLRFQSSKTIPGEIISLADYSGRMQEGQKVVYYLHGSTREIIETGPYMEAFREKEIEVLYLLDSVDDFVMTALNEFEGKKLVSADQAELDLPIADGKKDEEGKPSVDKGQLDPGEVNRLTTWMKEVLGDMVSDVRESRRLVDSPAIIVNPDQGMTTSMQCILQAANKDFGTIGPKVLEINTNNSVITRLAKLVGKEDEVFLRFCVEQIADNAFLAAGLPGNRQKTVDRIYKIIDKALGV